MKTIDFSKPAPAHNPFTVPTDYFVHFTERMMQRIAESSPQTAARCDLPIIRWIPWLGAVSVAALVALFTIFSTPTTLNDVVTTSSTETVQAKTNNTQTSDMLYDYLIMADADNYLSYETDN